MKSTIGVCGYGRTGSSAYINLLREFSETQLFTKREFNISYFPDGLEDLDYHLNNDTKYTSYVTAINRFRKSVNISKIRELLPGNTINKLTEEFLSNIIQISWYGYGSIDKLIRPSFEIFLKHTIFAIAKITKIHSIRRLYALLFPHKFEISKKPSDFESCAKKFILNILAAMGRNTGLVTVLDQPFNACNPLKSFKYFENPKAIVVNRDPRDHYLHIKLFDRKKGNGYQIPCDDVNTYISYYKLFHGNFKKDDNENILYLNFEELVYDYENTVKKVSEFAEVSNHINKGKYFNIDYSRNNTQLFKKYKKHESDIIKIENELSEYLYAF